MSRLKAELGVLQGSGLLATSLLGTGIFVVPVLAAQSSGELSLLAWGVLILFVCPMAWTFGLLGREFPHAGGAAHIVSQAFGKTWGKLTALMFLSVLPVGLPAALMMAVGFWHAVMDLSAFQSFIIQAMSILLMLCLGLGGAKLSGNVQVVIALCIVLMVVSIFAVSPELIQLPILSIPPTSFALVSSALGLMFWCFVGIEAFMHLGEEFKNPRRDFPIALVIGLVTAGSVYFLCSLAVVNSQIYQSIEYSSAAIPLLMGQLFGKAGILLASIVGFLACFASINIYLQGFSRLLWSLAEEGQLGAKAQRHLGSLNHSQVPVNALIWVSAICLISLCFSYVFELNLDSLIRYANGNFILVYLLCMLAGVRLLGPRSKPWALLSACICSIVFISLGMEILYAIAIFLLFFCYRSVARYYDQGVSDTENRAP